MGKGLIESGWGNRCFKLIIGCCVESAHPFSSAPSMITIRVTQPFPAIIDPEILPCPYLFSTQPPKKSARVHPAVTMTTIRTTWPCKREMETSGSWKGVSWLGIHLRCVACKKDGMIISLRQRKYRWLVCLCLLVAFLRASLGSWPFRPLRKLTAYSHHPACNRNGHQEYFLRGKDGRCIQMITYHLHVPNVLKSGSFNFLEPSGPVQACNGIALPLTVTITQAYSHP